MRVVILATWLTIPAMIVASQPSASSTTSAPTSNPTVCGDIINQAEHNEIIVDAVQAVQCLKSVPFHADVANHFLRYLNDTIQFQSTLAYLANPPPGYQQPAVDIVAELTGVQRRVDTNNFTNQYDFETAIQTILNAAHDDHLSMRGGILSAFVYGAPFDIVSLSEDGIQLPKVYHADSMIPDAWDNINQRPSAISSINGEDPIEYLTRFGAMNSLGKLESHAEWNMLMRSGALDSQGQLEVFFGKATSYPGDTITYTLENGTVVGPQPWRAFYLGPPNTGPLETGGDFYNLFVLGLYPASYQDNSQQPAPSTPASSALPSATPTSYSKPSWDVAYPTPQSIPHGNSKDNGLPRVFFLRHAKLGVLSIPEFTAADENTVTSFMNTVRYFIRQSKKEGLKKLVIDVQQNMGGSPLLAIEVFKSIFPSHEPLARSRRRAHTMADALGRAITSYWETLNPDDYDHNYLISDEWMVADRLNPETGEVYPSWNDYFQSASSYGNDHFTNLEQYNLSNPGFMQEAAHIDTSKMAMPQSPLYSAEDIIILSDGICSSACSVFMELMHHQADVRTVVVGGKPDFTPMQAPSGTRGAASYGTDAMDIDIQGARRVSNSTAVLPADRTHAFHINSASVNLRDQIPFNDTSDTPWQFQFEQADCRIFFTPKTWYNFTNLWTYASEATWKNSTLCIAKSADLTRPRPSSIPSMAPESTTAAAVQSKATSGSKPQQSDDSNGSSNPILDAKNGPIPNMLGQACSPHKGCHGNYVCAYVPRYNTKSPICTKPCYAYNVGQVAGCGTGSTCDFPPSDFHIRGWAQHRGSCIPDTRKWLSGKQSGSQPNSAFLGTGTFARDETNIPSCMGNQNLHNAYMHCFQTPNPNYQKCLYYTNAKTPYLHKDVFCAQSELEIWMHVSGHERTYDFSLDGSKAFLRTASESSGPHYIVMHGGESQQTFKDEFEDSYLAPCTRPRNWPVEDYC